MICRIYSSIGIYQAQMAQEGEIPFLSKEGDVISFNSEYLKYSELLEMLYRRSQGRTPISTSVCAHDLQLTQVICYSGLYPCTHQTRLRPEEFDSFQGLCDYMGVVGAEEDTDNEHLNDFLCLLGQEEVPEEPSDPYGSWTEEELKAIRDSDNAPCEGEDDAPLFGVECEFDYDNEDEDEEDDDPFF
jgi:hypothetical protein